MSDVARYRALDRGLRRLRHDIGLSRWLAEQDPRWAYRLSFERPDHSFYRAAQHGLAGELS